MIDDKNTNMNLYYSKLHIWFEMHNIYESYMLYDL